MTLLDQWIFTNLIFFPALKTENCKAKILEQNGSSQTKFTVALVRPKGFHQAGSGLPYFFIRQMLRFSHRRKDLTS